MKLQTVLCYTMKEHPIDALIQELHAHHIEIQQILWPFSDSLQAVELNQLEKIDGILCIAESAILCKQLKEKQIPVIALLDTNYEQQDYGTVRYAVTDMDAVNYEYLLQVYQRYKGIPWTILTTKRCIIREIAISDVAELYRLYQDASITEYMEDLYEITKETEYTKQYMEHIYGFYEYGMWLVIEKQSGTIIGRAGIEQFELGYMIGKAYQRQGFAYEVCMAIMQYARVKLELNHLESMIRPENKASIALIRKLGFMEVGEWCEQNKRMIHYWIDLQ
ncbi:MAG: GNAT family N-acetyltransferase [Lachnospiraceae bacterium]